MKSEMDKGGSHLPFLHHPVWDDRVSGRRLRRDRRHRHHFHEKVPQRDETKGNSKTVSTDHFPVIATYKDIPMAEKEKNNIPSLTIWNKNKILRGWKTFFALTENNDILKSILTDKDVERIYCWRT